jgi:hypothetical protein
MILSGKVFVYYWRGYSVFWALEEHRVKVDAIKVYL